MKTNKDFEHSVNFWKDLAEMRESEAAFYKQQCEKLRDALRFYGDPENWIKRNIDSWETSNPREYGDSEIIQKYKHPNTDWTGSVVIGGKRARQALGGE